MAMIDLLKNSRLFYRNTSTKIQLSTFRRV